MTLGTIHPAPTISLTPSAILVDEPVSIRLSRLLKDARVSLHAQMRTAFGTVTSFAIFQTDEQGVVDLATQPSLGGTYEGIDPMGLFWSMTKSSTFTSNDTPGLLETVTFTVEMAGKSLEGAGHAIHIRYMPTLERNASLGGSPRHDAAASLGAWTHVRTFLDQHLKR